MTDSRIRILDRIVADQIAAGEVVERPASVVKELVENALDAGASRVQVEIDGGGSSRLRVLDNGGGMSAQEAELAFTRHATSKITGIEDLAGVATYGFRGEALPSIAAVSRVVVRTRTADSVSAALLELAGGEIVGRREAGAPVGTDVEVRDLFFNTPARLKFLKREVTEAGHCAEAVVRLALVRPEVSFVLFSGGRRTRELTRAERVEERVAALFPGERLARVAGSDSGIEILAVLGPPERARAGAGSLYTYVNGRYVRDRALLSAVARSFGGTLEPGRYPAGLVSLRLPAGSFDVNVHPQKTEVRFADSRAVQRAVTRIAGELAGRAVWALGTTEQAAGDAAGRIAETAASYPERARLVPLPPAPRPDNHRATTSAAAPGGPVELFRDSARPAAGEDRAGAGFGAFHYIGQAANMFLLFEDGDDLVLIDQHAAHERVTYDRLRRQLEQGAVASQRLLTPHAVELGPADADRIAGLEEDLGRLGLEISRGGVDRIDVRAVPAELAGVAPDRLLAGMVLALEEGREGSRGERDDRVLATMACHGSIRGGQRLDEDEVRALLAAMDTIGLAGHCPH
ncbi:MAG TPA: DNA mismatch repair endonuclease MutL, partial [Polyangia bacterium]|nr:DNA mismatch repair endonuclease MutL [Polyangia bacterium]